MHYGLVRYSLIAQLMLLRQEERQVGGKVKMLVSPSLKVCSMSWSCVAQPSIDQYSTIYVTVLGVTAAWAHTLSALITAGRPPTTSHPVTHSLTIRPLLCFAGVQRGV